jgi:hypothetical protein
MFLALCAAVSLRAAFSGAKGSPSFLYTDGSSEAIAGVLTCIPEPDVSICFCGSFRFVSEAGFKECYLVSNTIDLGAFDGQRILVFGRSFSGLCTGTLARPCSFIEVEKVVALSRTGVARIDWGMMKIIYR